MTIATTSSKTIGRGNGLTTAFNYSFLIPDASSLQITYTDTSGNATILGASQYTVSGLGVASGGTVTYPLSGSPIPTGSSITIERILPLIQPISLLNQGGYFPAAVENAFDRLIMLIQQLAGGALNYALALTFPTVDVAPTTVLPPAAARANKYFAFDLSGNPTMMSGTSSSPDLSANTAVSTGGSTARSLAARFADWVNVLDYGALGNGSHDDTTAIQAAFTRASALALSEQPTNDVTRFTIPRVFFPKGIYKVTAQLNLPDVMLIDGDNAILDFGGTVNYGLYNANTPYLHDIRNIAIANCVVAGIYVSKVNANYQELNLSRVIVTNCATGVYAHHPTGNLFVRLNDCALNGATTFADIACDVTHFNGCYFGHPIDAGAPASSGTVLLTGNVGGSNNGEASFVNCHFGPPGVASTISERAWVRADSMQDVVFVQTNFGGEVGRRTALNANSCGGVSFNGCSANALLDTVGHGGGTIGYCRMFGNGCKSFTVIGGRISQFFDFVLDWSVTVGSPDNTQIYHINILGTSNIDRTGAGSVAPFNAATVQMPSYLQFKTMPFYVNNEQVHTKKIVLRDGNANDITSTLDVVFQHGLSTDYDQAGNDPGPMIRATKTGVYGGAAGTKAAQFEFHTTFNGVTSQRVTIRDSGGLCPSNADGTSQTVGAIFAGAGVPSNTNGQNGDFYLRTDGGAGTCLYQKRAGAWVATTA